ncbi:beta-galactosidase-like isoform X1 [Haemaphysalis longicornis]
MGTLGGGIANQNTRNNMARYHLISLSLLGLFITISDSTRSRSFTVDYENDRFLKDGQPFRYISGSLHYFRVPKQYWKDRMEKMRLAGLNALQTYVEWSGHEPEPGKYHFSGDYDLKAFLDTAKDVGLLVILRPGPYICAERDNGGLPYWLLRVDPNMKYRTSDKSYIEAVDKWFGVLLPMVKPYLYKNGGPIIKLQVENEYGHYCACDSAYMQHLVNITRHYLGQDTILFRSDGPDERRYRCDNVSGKLATANFRSLDSAKKMLGIVRRVTGRGPLIVTEYFTGWFDNWHGSNDNTPRSQVLKTFKEILHLNASVNFYMFHGGTNFGFMNGANPLPVPTSYDYGAILTEAGDPTDTYFKIRDVVGRYLPLPRGPLPVPAPKLKLGTVHLKSCASLEAILVFLRKRGFVVPVSSKHPKSFEELGQAYGYVLYSTAVQFNPKSPAILTVPGIKNRGYVFTRQTRAVLSHYPGIRPSVDRVPVVVQKGEKIVILVENTGRENFGRGNHDMKGILGNVTLDCQTLTNWTMEPLPLSIPEATGLLVDAFGASASAKNQDEHCSAPGAFFGEFVLPEGQPVLDTFLDPTGWGKGVAFVNNFNLGRYWPSVGPQVTLYVPGVVLLPYPQKNTIFLFETEAAPSGNRTVSFVDVPNIDGPSTDCEFGEPEGDDCSSNY